MSIAELIAHAKEVNGKFDVGRQYSAGNVSAAIETASGEVFTGISIEITCGGGICAEHSAIAEMLKSRYTHIARCVAILREQVVPPCGRCRELMILLDPRNKDTEIILDYDNTCKLSTLLPHHWLDTNGV